MSRMPDQAQDLTPAWVRFFERIGRALKISGVRRMSARSLAREMHRQRRMGYALGLLAAFGGLLALLPGTLQPTQAGSFLLNLTPVAGVFLARGFFEPELGQGRLEERLQATGFSLYLATRVTALVLVGLLALLPAVTMLVSTYADEASAFAVLLAVARTLLFSLAVACWCQCRLASVPAGLTLALVLLIPATLVFSNMGGVLNPWQNPITVSWGTGMPGAAAPGLKSSVPNFLVMVMIARLMMIHSMPRVWRLLRAG